jgi:hypothetical protein
MFLNEKVQKQLLIFEQIIKWQIAQTILKSLIFEIDADDIRANFGRIGRNNT